MRRLMRTCRRWRIILRKDDLVEARLWDARNGLLLDICALDRLSWPHGTICHAACRGGNHERTTCAN